jgi:hypothetical protein
MNCNALSGKPESETAYVEEIAFDDRQVVMPYFDLLGIPGNCRDPVAAIQRFLHNVRADFSGCAVDNNVERLVGVHGVRRRYQREARNARPS